MRRGAIVRDRISSGGRELAVRGNAKKSIQKRKKKQRFPMSYSKSACVIPSALRPPVHALSRAFRTSAASRNTHTHTYDRSVDNRTIVFHRPRRNPQSDSTKKKKKNFTYFTNVKKNRASEIRDVSLSCSFRRQRSRLNSSPRRPSSTSASKDLSVFRKPFFLFNAFQIGFRI